MICLKRTQAFFSCEDEEDLWSNRTKGSCQTLGYVIMFFIAVIGAFGLLDLLGLFGSFLWGEITHTYNFNVVCGTWPFRENTPTNGPIFTCFAFGIPILCGIIGVIMFIVWLLRAPLTDLYNRYQRISTQIV